MLDYRAPVVAPPPAPPPLRALLFPLVVSVEGVDVVVRRSRRLYVVRGLLAVIALPILFGLLMLLLGVGMLDGETSIEPLAALWFGLSGLSLLFGVGLIALSGPLSRRGVVRFDRTRGVVLAGGAAHPFPGLEVRVREREGLNAWRAIELHRQGHVIATLHDRLQSIHTREIAAASEYVACLLGADPPTPSPSLAGPLALSSDDRTSAMLCYLPFQGVNLMASLWFVFQAKNKPFVQFAAKQSLSQMGTTAVGVVAVSVLFGVPLAVVASGETHLSIASTILIVALGISLLAIAIANFGACITACVRAYRGQVWVIPWLRPIVTKWLPPSSES